jgi:hypothetical protein
MRAVSRAEPSRPSASSDSIAGSGNSAEEEKLKPPPTCCELNAHWAGFSPTRPGPEISPRPVRIRNV